MSKEVVTFAAAPTVTDRRIEALAVPYNEPTSDGRNIAFSVGAFGATDHLAGVAVYVNHPIDRGMKPVKIGKVSAWTDGEHGMTFAADVFDGETEDLIYEALKAGEITDVSVSVFAHEISERDGITYYDQVEPIEISLMVGENGAFASSKITAVFAAETQTPEAPVAEETPEKETPNMENLETQVSELAGAVDDLSREVASFASVNVVTTPAVSKFASFGAVVKAVANGDEEAKAELESFAYEGAVSDDTTITHAWSKPILDYIDLRRPVLNIWNKYPDPKKNTVEYIVEDADSLQVAEQVNEGDDLVYGKFSLDTETTRMRTYGGYTEFSLQAIERSDVSVIDQGYKRLAREYAKATESVVRTTLLGASAPTVTGLNLSNFGTVIDVTVDAAGKLDDAGHVAEVIIIDRQTFKTLAKLDSDKQFILSRDTGSVNVPGIGATLFGIPVKVVNFGSPVFFFANSEALSVWESGVGKLSDSNIVNLTSAVSLFGHMGAAVTDPSALVKVTA